MASPAWNLVRLAALLVSSMSGLGAAIADGISIWSIVDRDGPSAAATAPVTDGLRDYLAMINARDGGLNGVTLVHTECNAGLSSDGSATCYNRAKAAAIAILPLSSAIALELLPSAGRDAVPMLAAGMGAAMIADGRYFPWAFAMPATDIDGAQVILQAISGQADALQGKTIALLRLDGPENEDIAALLQMQSARLGFTLLEDAETRAILGRAGRERYLHLFTREALIKRTLEFYRETLSRRAQRSTSASAARLPENRLSGLVPAVPAYR